MNMFRRAPEAASSIDGPEKLPAGVISLRLVDNSAQYGKLLAQIADVQRQDAELVKQINAVAQVEVTEASLDDQARKFLDGGPLVDTAGGHNAADQIAALESQRRVLRASARLLNIDLASARGEASQAVIAKIKPEYLRRVARVAEAFANLLTVNEELEEMIGSLERAEVSFYGISNTALSYMIGRAADNQCMAALWFREAVERKNAAAGSSPALAWQASNRTPIIDHLNQGNELMSTKELREQRARVIQTAQAMLDNQPKNRPMTAEQDAQFDALMAEAEVMKIKIDRADRFAASSKDEELYTSERKAFLNFIRNGHEMNEADRQTLAKRKVDPKNSMGVSTGSAGGFTVPDSLASEIMTAQQAFGGMLDAGCTIMNATNGGPFWWPTNNDTSNMGSIVGENTTMTDGADFVFQAVGFTSYMYTSKQVKFSIQLLQDSDVDIEALLADQLGTRIARRVNLDLTVGTGVGQPRGITLDAPVGATCALGETTSLIWDDLLNLEHSVDAAYRKNAKFMFGDQTFKAIKKLKDTQNRPLWLPGVKDGAPDTLLGYPIVINYAMPAPAAWIELNPVRRLLEIHGPAHRSTNVSSPQ